MTKISGGALGGRVLRAVVPEGVRPTAIRTRAALFSMLGQDLAGWSFLDACGGTGLMAVEAWSRGAWPVITVERDSLAARGIAENLNSLKLLSGVAPIQMVQGDARRVVLPQVDVVYLDPPYKEPIGPWIEWAATLARRYVIAEARAGGEWPAPPPGFELDRVRRHGDAEIAFYAASAPE